MLPFFVFTKSDNVRMEKNGLENKPFQVVLVKGLTHNVRSAHVSEIFSNFGKVNNVKFAYVKGHSVGWAYVYYATPEDAKNAVNQMNGGYIDGVQISVSLTDANNSIEDLYFMSK